MVRQGLVADVGGTNARLAIADGDGSLHHVEIYRCEDYSSFAELVRQYLERIDIHPRLAAIAIAGPVVRQKSGLTNGPWGIDAGEMVHEFSLSQCLLVNDFTALAWSLIMLEGDELEPIGPKITGKSGVRAVLGPGTGLGVSSLVPVGNTMFAMAGEGGHVSFAPVDRLEAEILKILQLQFGRVSVERILCGAGLVNLHRALAEIEGRKLPDVTPEQITDEGLGDADSDSARTLKVFAGVLGSFAGDLALTTGATAGVYVTGGVGVKIGSVLQSGGFRQRFEDKGRMSALVSGIPTYLVTAPTPALVGLAARLFRTGYY